MSDRPEKTKYPYGYGLGKISLAKLYTNKANVMKWSGVLSISGIAILMLWMFLKRYVFKIDTKIFVDSYALALAFFIWGLLGLFWAQRRQVPQIITVRGKPAFIMGLFMMIGCWIISANSFIRGLLLMMKVIK